MTSKESTLYNDIYDIYDKWIQGDRISSELIEFYHTLTLSLDKHIKIVELGIGTGRISINIAKKQNRDILGIDNSFKMLEECRNNIIKNNLENKIKLIQMDIKELKLREKANFIILPYGTIGHFLTTKEKKTILKQIYNNLEIGGIFVFDDYILERELANKQNNIYIKAYSEKNLTIYNKSIFDFKKQKLHCTIYEEKNNNKPTIKSSFEYSWINPLEMKEALLEVGFKIKASYGNFDFDPITSNSTRQIWVTKRDL